VGGVGFWVLGNAVPVGGEHNGLGVESATRKAPPSISFVPGNKLRLLAGGGGNGVPLYIYVKGSALPIRPGGNSSQVPFFV